jgi:hypothetical protein
MTTLPRASGWRDTFDLLALAWSIPFAILLVGAPVAIVIALAVRLARLMIGGL